VTPSATAWSAGLSGTDALHRYAPEVAETLQRLVRTISADPRHVALVRWACASAQDLPALPAPPGAEPLPAGVTDRAWSTLPDADRTILSFAEQFSVDVSALGDRLRSELWTVLGEEPQQARGRLLAMTWVADFVPRVRTALDRLFTPSGPLEPPRAVETADDATPLGREFVRVVHTLHDLDPVLSEMVRLRVARAHDCRMCKSLRTRSALAAGATERDFAAIDDHRSSALSARQKAALAMVDGILWFPARIPEPVVEAVRGHFAPAQAVEIVLDVMRNSWNKTTVAAVLDEAHVSEGVELYEYHDDGTLEFFPLQAEPHRTPAR
jgi:AhpD family alkylhydroperoxidase